MAATDWYSLYRDKTDAELDAAITALEAKLDGGFSSQQVGSKGYTRDLGLLRDRLTAAVYVRNERRQGGGGNVNTGGYDPTRGVMDFSNVLV